MSLILRQATQASHQIDLIATSPFFDVIFLAVAEFPPMNLLSCWWTMMKYQPDSTSLSSGKKAQKQEPISVQNSSPLKMVPKHPMLGPKKRRHGAMFLSLFMRHREMSIPLISIHVQRECYWKPTNLVMCSFENLLLTIERSCLDVATMEVHPLVVAGGVDSTAEGRRKANICWSLRDPHMVRGY